MIYETQIGQSVNQKVKQSEQAFTYNVLVPDFVILTIGITSGFTTLLTIFS